MVRRIFDFRDRSDVLKYVNDPKNEIKFVRILIPDLLGRIKYVSVPISEINDVFSDGLIIRGQMIDGNKRQNEFDLHLKPEPKSTFLIPFTNRSKNDDHIWREAYIFGDFYTLKGEAFIGDSRNVFKKTLEKVKSEYKIDNFMVEPRIEFFLFPMSDGIVDIKNLVQNSNCFLNNKIDRLRKEIVLSLKDVGIDCILDCSKENCFLQQIKLKSKSALEIADKFMIFKYIVRIVAEDNGFLASFMPKPFSDKESAGLHLSYRALSKGKDVFEDLKDSFGLSIQAKRFIGGILHYSRETSLITSQFVNSYKRTASNNEAPSHIYWGVRNTLGLIKVGPKSVNNKQKISIDVRSPDSCCNIYLTMAVHIMSGLTGIKNAVDADAAVNVSLTKLSRERMEHIKRLPSNFSESLNEAKNSMFLEKILGASLYERFILEKEYELSNFSLNGGDLISTQISDYELKELLYYL